MSKLTKEDVIAKLTELKVEFDKEASYNDLLKLLKDSEPKEEKITQSEPKEEKITMESEGVTAEEKKAVEEIKEKSNPFFSFNDKTPLTKKAHEMRKKLMHQVRVPVMIPLGHEEKVGSTHQVTLNGYTMFIMKGVMVDVPLQVAQVLEEKFRHQRFMREHPLLVSSGDPRDIKLQKFD